MGKKIGLVVTLVVIFGAIWYLQSIKAKPAQQGSAAVSEDVVAPSESIAPDSSEVPGGAMAGKDDTHMTDTTPQKTIASIAADDKKAGYSLAKEITDPSGFVNTDPFRLSDVVGKKVILVDFWTYSCINCIRTLPYVTAWYDKYHDKGLEIVGIHTPEFEFEKNYDNVKAATVKYGIHYPVVLDNNRGTWTAYNNFYWPHEYLIDIAGYVVHDHIGEGGYAETEQMIQDLLDERTEALGMNEQSAVSAPVQVALTEPTGVMSRETYFGSARNDYLANGLRFTAGEQTLTEPASVTLNSLYLSGTWNFMPEYATNVSAGAKIIFKYHSGKVFFVASAPQAVTVQVLRDGAPLIQNAGSDVKNGILTVQESRLYNIVNDVAGSSEHTLEFIINSPGLQAYTFTFG